MDSEELNERFLTFVADLVNMLKKLSETHIGKLISSQLFRSASSSGANYQEACAGESRADFIHKLQIVLKELRESIYWLRLIGKLSLVSSNEIDPMINEARQLANIIGKSIVTSKSPRKKN